LIHMFIKSG